MWRTASSAVGSELKGSTVGPPNQKSDDKLCFEAYLEEAVAQSNFGERSRVRAFMIAVYTEVLPPVHLTIFFLLTHMLL